MLPRNVLIFHAGALGDLILSFPLALALGRLYPTSRVRYVTAASKGKLAGRVLGVEHVDVEGGWSGLFADGVSLPDPVTQLLAGSHRIVSFVAGPGDPWARRVAELAPSATRMFLRTLPPPGRHAADWLLEQCGRTDLGGDRAIAAAVDQVLGLIRRQGLARRTGKGRGVLLHPGAGAVAKCWPLDSFRELALRLRDQGHDIRWVLGEVELQRLRSEERRALEALGDVVVPGDYLSLLEELGTSRVFVGNDSGPTHLAAIEGVPTVALFGPTDPTAWAPIGPAVAILRAADADIAGIEVDAVRRQVEALHGS